MLIILFITGILMWVIGSRLEKRQIEERDRELDDWLHRRNRLPKKPR